MSNSRYPIIETWMLREVTPPQYFAQYLRDFTHDELNELARELEWCELRKRIEVLPDGTIIRGYPWIEALKYLGYLSHDIRVCHDLVTIKRGVLEGEFFYDYLRHCKPGMVTRARIVARLHQLEQQQNHAKPFPADDHVELCSRIGRALGDSARGASSYVRLIRMPRPLQDAVEDGKLALTKALKVAELDAQQQMEIGEAIARGTRARAAVTNGLHRSRR